MNAITGLPAHLAADVALRRLNTALMAAWIGADPDNRCGLSTRTSTVLYDEFGVFVAALVFVPDEELLRKIAETTEVRFWTQGIEPWDAPTAGDGWTWVEQIFAEAAAAGVDIAELQAAAGPAGNWS